jgi:hypothetical protein
MSETSSLRPGESDGPRNLRDRIVDAFRSPPQAGLGISTTGNQSGNTTEPDVTTRLLDSYNNVDPACGERRCSHGTFSPQVEDAGRRSYIGGLDGFGYNGHCVATSAAGRPRGVDDRHPESVPESETPSQMKSSVLSSNDTRKQYAKSIQFLMSNLVACFRSVTDESIADTYLITSRCSIGLANTIGHYCVEILWPR